MNLTGKLYKKLNKEVKSDNFTIQKFVIEITETFKDIEKKQHVIVEAYNNTIQQLDAVKQGQEIRVMINVKGKEWQSPSGDMKYFNTLRAWKIEHFEEVTNEQQQPSRDLDFDPPF